MKIHRLILPLVSLLFAASSYAASAVSPDLERGIERAYLHTNTDELVAAIAPIEKALAAEPSNPALLYERAFAHYAASSIHRVTHDKEGMEADFEAANALLARVKGQPWEAEASALHSSILGQLIGLKGGMSGMTLGPKSNQLMARAARQAPDSPRVLLFQGISLLNTPPMFGGDPAKGAKLIERAVDVFAQVDPNAAGPHWGQLDALAWLGIVKNKAGDPAGARTAWQKALAIDPNYGWVKFALLPSLDALPSN